MVVYRNWADQLFPSLTFQDFVARVEALGASRVVRVRPALSEKTTICTY